MKKIKRLLSVQDLSCVGQCSLTVALPIISSFGIETCVLPTALLSNHTAFGKFTFKDLTEETAGILDCWRCENIKFDAFYSGYIGAQKQIDYFKNIVCEFSNENAVTIIDPVMGDNGKLYTGFDGDYVEAVQSMLYKADVILPNITEACLLTGTQYYDGTVTRDYIRNLSVKLSNFGVDKIIITTVSFEPDMQGIAMYDKSSDDLRLYFNKTVKKMSHGTGDVFASAFTGAYLNTDDFFESGKIAADFTVKALKQTLCDTKHWYGVNFEGVLSEYNPYVK